jgi:hypothetical protein
MDVDIPPGAVWSLLEQQDERLRELCAVTTRLEEKIEGLAGGLSNICEGYGTARCVERGERLRVLEKSASKISELPKTNPACVEARDRLAFLETKFDKLNARLMWILCSALLSLFTIASRTLWSIIVA